MTTKNEIDKTLMMRIVADVLDNDLETLQAKIPDDFDYSRLFLIQPVRLERVYDTVHKTYKEMADDHQETVNIRYWDEREAWLTQALEVCTMPKQQKKLQAELDQVMEKKRARFFKIASPSGPPNWAYEARRVAFSLVRILRAKDRSDEFEHELGSAIEALFKARIAETIRPDA